LLHSKIRTILPRHEQGGAFAAAGFARATGKTGVCMATSGPGATNLLTGIADAFLDSIPLVAITGQVPSTLIGKSAFQEIDIIGMTRPIVKHSYLVLNVEDIPAVFAEAFHIANSGRPGPVVIDLPKDVQQAKSSPELKHTPSLRAYHPDHSLDSKNIDSICAALEKSTRPCIYAGGGIIASGANKELTKFAETNRIPVVTTLMGVGAFPENNELSLKWLGMHGTVYANNAANECDLLLVFGARFDDRVTGPPATFAKDTKIVHVDIDMSEINKNKKADVPVIANVKDVLAELNKRNIKTSHNAWLKQVAKWKREYPLRIPQSKEIAPQEVVAIIHKLTKGEAVIVPGVGQHQMWAAQFYDYSFPRQLLTSGGLGTMGFGLPSAMGAKIALPDKTVVNIDGDGSAQMNIQELGTIHNENIDVKIVILNNQHLGMVAQWEDRFYGSARGNTDLRNARSKHPYPDFVSIAAGYQIPGREVYKKKDLKPAIKEMLEHDGAFLLDVHVEYQEHVLPMIPPGKSYKGILVE
ncbi:MAG: biosynthetic-type acetolactate synthase large subunit, partial [Victivallales bacterium]|nr:biosynthetic-type acetolactate synthase large subunit [Victivallales bacterium]